MNSIFDKLHPLLRPLAMEWLQKYLALGRKARITQTWRSTAYQAELHRLDPKGAAPPGKSKHEFTIEGKPASRAFDFALFDNKGKYITDGTHPYYKDAGQIARDLGLKWGGDFKTRPDWDHIELME